MPLALVVVNDDSTRCKKMAAIAIKALLSQLSTDHLNALYDLVNTWLTADKVASFFYEAPCFHSTRILLHFSLMLTACGLLSQTSLRRLGAQVCGLFVEVEQENFGRRLESLLPLLEKATDPDNYEDVSPSSWSLRCCCCHRRELKHGH